MVRFLSFALMLLACFSIQIDAAHACEVGDGKELCETQNGHYRVLLPKGTGPHPTVMYLYGSTGQSADLASEYSPLQLYRARGYAVIVPAALDVFYNDPNVKKRGKDSGWHLRNERIRDKRDEVAFLTEVLRDAANRHGIDRQRVLMMGQSRGGFLTWEVACHAPQLARAYAPHAAGYLGKMPTSCARPVRMLHTHGRTDPIVPVAPSEPWFSGGARMTPIRESLTKIGAVAGCTHPGTKKQFKEYERTTWWGCQRGSSVELMLHDGGHNPPLSWFTSAIDWFEQGGSPATAGVTGGTARFTATGEGGEGRLKATERGGNSRFKSSSGDGSLLSGGNARSNNRFKKAKVPSQ